MFQLTGEPLGPGNATKKGGFIRKFLVSLADGKREVINVYADSAEKLSGDAPRKMTVRPGDLVFLAQ